MVGIYFSGTGNTKYCVNKFLEYYDNDINKIESYAIEDKRCLDKIKENSTVIFGYPVHYSDIPIIVRNFIKDNSMLFKDKNVFIITTMGLFSGDGAGCSARLLKKYGANILGGVHLKMPDCIGDVKTLKKSMDKNIAIVKKTDNKIKMIVANFKRQKYSQDGLKFINHLLGLLGQRLWYYRKTYKLRNKLKIDYDKCIACEQCINLCPMKNIKIVENKPTAQNNCTCCYRCINHCPKKAITLIGKEVIEQCTIEKYTENLI